MSFQLAVLLVALEREPGRMSRAQSRSISISASTSTSLSSGGGSMRRGGVGEGGGRADDRLEAMCLSRTAKRHEGKEARRRIYLFDGGRGRDRLVGLGRSSPTAGSSLAHCNYRRRSAGMLVQATGACALCVEEIINCAVKDPDITEREYDKAQSGPDREAGRRGSNVDVRRAHPAQCGHSLA